MDTGEKFGMYRFYSFFDLFSIIPRLSFCPRSLLCFIPSIKTVDQAGCAKQRLAGRQAEGWSIKLLNHFLFSLRTAVDW